MFDPLRTLLFFPSPLKFCNEVWGSTASFRQCTHTHKHTHTHTRLTALFPGLPGRAGTRKVKPIWILLKQETVSGSGISWAICKSAPCSRQITTPAPTAQFFTGRMPFLPPNQQRQSTEGTSFRQCLAKKLQSVARVGGDQMQLVPVISEVGGDASHRSHRVVAPMPAWPECRSHSMHCPIATTTYCLLVTATSDDVRDHHTLAR